MSHTILCVDDDPAILKSLRRVFIYSDYKVFFAESGSEALAILDTGDIDLIISDMRMPEMNGYELLSLVKEKHPNSIRIILSGYTDKELILKSIINGIAKTYIMKPWDNEELLKYVNHLFTIYDAINSKPLKEIVNGIDNLPVLPQIFTQSLLLIEKDASFDKLAKVIEQDPIYLANVLKVANSSAYGITTTDATKAISFIGIHALKTILFTTSVFEVLKEKGSNPNDEYATVLEHSIQVNELLNSLYKFFKSEPLPKDYRTLGLIHDIGVLFMLMLYPKSYRLAMLSSGTIVEKESKKFSIDHCHLGAFLLDWWNFPTYAIELSLYHHDPLNSNAYHKDLLCFVYLANELSHCDMIEVPTSSLPTAILAHLNIDIHDLERFIDTYNQTHTPGND